MLLNEWLDLFVLVKAPDPRVGNDVIAWLPIVDGVFTLKSAYKIWTDKDVIARSQLYNNMWKIKAPQRIKAFNVAGCGWL